MLELSGQMKPFKVGRQMVIALSVSRSRNRSSQTEALILKDITRES